jgi:dTDP-glucose pyrophosphorylase
MMNILIPMAGSDESFRKHGFPFAKPVTEIDGSPLIEHAFNCLKEIPNTRFVFVIRKDDALRFHLRDVLKLLDPHAAVILADGETAGAACTALLAVDYISNDDELLIANGDQILNFDVNQAIDSLRKRELDAGTVVFNSVHPRWSFVKTNEAGLIVEAAEKRPVSRNATAGLYYFKKGEQFVSSAFSMIRKGASVNGAYFVCPTFNELILLGKRIGLVTIERDQYISLATPQAIEEYEQLLAAKKQSESK